MNITDFQLTQGLFSLHFLKVPLSTSTNKKDKLETTHDSNVDDETTHRDHHSCKHLAVIQDTL